MAKRDVELVVRARNEASKAIESVTSALEDLTKSQSRVSDGSEKTGSTLARLGDELKKLTAQLTSATGVDKLATSMDRAEKSVARLEQSLTKTAEDAVRLETELEQATASVAKFAAESEKLKNTLAQQKQTVASTQSEYKKLAAELKAGEDAIAGSRAKSQQYVDSLGKQTAALGKTEAKHRELATAILSATNPSSKLLDNFEKIDVKLRKQAETLSRTKNDYAAYRSTIGQLSTEMPSLRDAVAAASAAFAAAQGSEKQTSTNLLEVDRASKQATAEFNRLQDAVAKTTVTLDKQQTSLADAKTNLRELAAATDLARRKAAELDAAAFRKVTDDAAKLNKASEYVRWWTQALNDADVAEDKLNRNPLMSGSRVAGYNQTAIAARSMATASKQAAIGLSEMEEKGRAAMTWAQRLRGEMVALTLSFAGVYAAINQMRAVLTTVIDMDAAQTRLGVAFGDNQAVIAKEMSFVQAQADRLGISVKVLATEYSKLAVATKDTSLAGAETRRIFVSLSEAFRVGNLTQNQMELAFNAISQMVNKGSVSMEELRQQLGERLAGAFNIAAKSMGYTTKEFAKLVATGQIAAEEFLPKLADELDKTFGPGLPRALQNIAKDVGAFENAVIKAQMNFAKGGFTEGLQDALRELTRAFQSDEGQKFFSNLGAVAGALVKVLAQIPKYADTIAIALSIVAAGKLVNYFGTLRDRAGQVIERFKTAAGVAQSSAAQFDRFGVAIANTAAGTQKANAINNAYLASIGRTGAAMATVTAQARVLTAATTALSGAMNLARGVFAALGGLPGIVATGLSVAFGYWLTKTGEVVDATSEHQRQMAALLQAYDQAKNKAGDWAKEVQSVSVAGAEKNLLDLQKQLAAESEKAARNIASKAGGFGTFDYAQRFGAVGKEVGNLTMEVVNGQRSIKSYRKALDEIVKRDSTPEGLKQIIRATDDLRQKASDTEEALIKQVAVVDKLGGSTATVSPIIKQMVTSFDDLAKGADTTAKSLDQIFAEAEKKLGEQIDLLKDKIPELAEEAKMLEELKSIDEVLKTADAIQGIDKTSDAYRRLLDLASRAKAEIRQAFDAKQFKSLEGLFSGTSSGADASAKLLRQFEGFRATPYYDVNAYRVGFGSDTVTLADGSIQKVVQGMKVSVEDANRDLVRRVGEFQGVIKGQIGADRFNSFSNEQQAALTSIAYNYGSLPNRIIEAVRTGSSQEIATAIRGLAGDNKGVNASRRNQEAFIFEGGGAADLKNIERQVELANQRAAKTKEYRDNLNEALTIEEQSAQAQLAAQDTRRKGVEMVTLEQAIQTELDKRRLAAKKQDQTLTAEQEAAIKRIVTLNYQREAQEKAALERQRQQTEGEQKISQLQQLRRDLLQQMQFAQEAGDTGKVRELADQISSVDVRLREAINRMREFWATSSDPEAREAALASLNALEQGLQNVGDKTKLTAKDFGNLFGENLQSAWSGFLSKVRDTGDVFGSLRESFRQFASDFLLQMAQMIAKVAILNALKGVAGSGGFFGQVFAGFAGTQLHNGGIVGSGGTARAVSPAWFQNAVRYHSGGIAGLKPNEVPAVLEKGEEVLTAGDPRHSMNGGGGSNVKIINAIDSGSVVSEGMSTAEGERAFINFIRANKATVKQVLG